jgi:hypothetical protein
MHLSTKVLLLSAATLTAGCAGGDGIAGSTGSAGPTGPGGPGSGSGAGGTVVGTGNVDNTGVTDPGPGATCGMKTFGLTKVPPDLLVVLDKSGSMNQTPEGAECGGTGSVPPCLGGKWPQMTDAIKQVVTNTDDKMRWGLKFFPDNSQCGVGVFPIVRIADRNASAVSFAMSQTSPNGATPTRIALAGATAYLATLTDPNPKFILLATDGLPNCALSGTANTPDAAGAIQAVTDSARNGIPVFVIGIGSLPEAQSTLTAMALAGGRPQAANPRYYPVANTAELVSVLGGIGDTIGSCSFGLGSAPPDPTNIRVSVNGTRVPNDPTHANGWDYGTGKTSVQLFGKWCDDAKAGKVKDVQAVFGCPGVVIP